MTDYKNQLAPNFTEGSFPQRTNLFALYKAADNSQEYFAVFISRDRKVRYIDTDEGLFFMLSQIKHGGRELNFVGQRTEEQIEALKAQAVPRAPVEPESYSTENLHVVNGRVVEVQMMPLNRASVEAEQFRRANQIQRQNVRK